MKKIQILFILVNFICCDVYSQSATKKFKISVVGGLTFRTTIMKNFDFMKSFGQTSYWNDYLHEKNIQGLSYQPGFKFNVPHPKVEITYRLGIRYDYTHDLILRWTDDLDEIRKYCTACPDELEGFVEEGFEFGISEFQKSWLFDHHFILMRRMKNNKHAIGVGISIVNQNEHYVDYYERKKEIEFMNYDLIYQRRIWGNIMMQANIIFIPKGQYPPDPSQNFLSYSVGLFYQLNIFKSP